MNGLPWLGKDGDWEWVEKRGLGIWQKRGREKGAEEGKGNSAEEGRGKDAEGKGKGEKQKE